MDLDRFTRFDWYSMSAVPIEMHFGEQPLSTGTAFFWDVDGQLYLVTAWHCLSGRHFQTKKHISTTSAEPDRIEVWWNLDRQPVGHKGTSFVPIRDEAGEPLWLIHPERGSDVDVAMLPVQCPGNAVAYPINKLPSDWIGLSVGQDVFILGFPLGIEGVRLPIWKRGSLASEWQISESVQPYWLVDTASRPGMSGSPVIQRAFPYAPELGQMMDYGRNGKTSFLGVYSGRLPSEGEKDLQLGLVWSEVYLDDIVRGQRRDGQPPVQITEEVAPR